MALGGASIGTWNEADPAGSEVVGLGDDRIRSTKTQVRTGLDSEHVWSSSGGTVGQHRPGAANAFYGLQSQVSYAYNSSNTSTIDAGRLMVTSDTSRLYSANSFGRTMLGAGPGSLSLDTFPSGFTFGPQNVRWAMEVGLTSNGSAFNVVFPNSGYSGIPFLQVSIFTQSAGGAPGDAARVWKLDRLTASGFSGQIVDATNNVSRNDFGIMWQSIGTRWAG